MVHASMLYAWIGLLSYGILSHAYVSASGEEEESIAARRRRLRSIFDEETKAQTSAPTVVTGVLDEASTLTFKSRLYSRSSGSFSLSLNLPDILSGKDGNGRHLLNLDLALDCDEGHSNEESPTSYYTCSNEKQRRRSLSNGDEASGTGSATKAYLGMNGLIVGGFIETDSARYQIRTQFDRRSGEVSYSYGAAKLEDTFYTHKGKKAEEPVEMEIGSVLDDSEGTRSLVRTAPQSSLSNASTSSAKYVPVNSSGIISIPNQRSSSTKKRKLSDDGSEIDLLIYYTQRGACQWLGLTYPCTLDSTALSTLESYAETWTNYMNTVLTNSQITGMTFLKVHVAVDASYDEGTSADTGDMLDVLTDPDGDLNNAHELRNQYSADFVVGFMYVEPSCSTCLIASGVGWVPDMFPEGRVGFSMTGGNYNFLNDVAVHEVGHNMGCNHHRSQYSSTDSSDYDYGYANCGQCWVTIMAYSSVCEGTCGVGQVTRLSTFGNPSVTYNGDVTGDSSNNNALQVSEAKYGIARNRYRGSRSLDKATSNAWIGDFQTLVFDVTAKTDLTITNYVTYMDATNRVVFSTGSSPYAGNELNDSYWTTVGDETITPLTSESGINANKIKSIGVFSSPLSVSVTSGTTISVRIQMPSGGGFKVGSGATLGNTIFENSDISVTGGRFGTTSFLYGTSYVGTMHDSLIYTVGSSTPAPSSKPSQAPSENPSSIPSNNPSNVASAKPSLKPSTAPSLVPSLKPSAAPSLEPSLTPSAKPSLKPSAAPSLAPTFMPSSAPSLLPSSKPSMKPSGEDSAIPSLEPSSMPSKMPSSEPSEGPSAMPSLIPSALPSNDPSSEPSSAPSLLPSSDPSAMPSLMPSSAPSLLPSSKPSMKPSGEDSAVPSLLPSSMPSKMPSSEPSEGPSAMPSLIPSALPSNDPSSEPSSAPSLLPSSDPSAMPSLMPSSAPSLLPSSKPSMKPSGEDSAVPSLLPSSMPSKMPSSEPTESPSAMPSLIPSALPSSDPSSEPSSAPSLLPSSDPSGIPSLMPSSAPSSIPSVVPSLKPSSDPSVLPSSKPSTKPSLVPSVTPSTSTFPSVKPSDTPSSKPSVTSSSNPTEQFVCAEDPGAEYVHMLKIKNGQIKKVVTKTCSFLVNIKSKKGYNGIKKFCESGLETDDFGSALDMCPITCDICDPPTPSPTTQSPTESPAPTETFVCEEDPGAEYVQSLKIKNGQIKKVVTKTCSFLVNIKSKKGYNGIKKFCESGLETDDFGSALDMCPITCEDCEPPTPSPTTQSPTESPAPTGTFECEEDPGDEYVHSLKMKNGQIKKVVTKTCALLAKLKSKKGYNGIKMFCESGLETDDVGSAMDVCPVSCEACD